MNNEKFLERFRSNPDAIWIKCELTNGEEYFEDNHAGWLDKVKPACRKNKSFIKDMRLQYRSHEINVKNDPEAEAVYLVRSVMGQMGVDSKQYYTTGYLKNGKMHKQMWLVPELIVEKELCDELDDCFEKAIIYNEAKKANREE